MGVIELKNLKEKNAIDPTYRKILNDFIKAIISGEPICKPCDKMMHQDRILVFLNLYNAFLHLMRGYGNLTLWQDKKSILERIKELRREASCNNPISDKENFRKNIDDLVKKYVPKADLKKFWEEQEKETK